MSESRLLYATTEVSCAGRREEGDDNTNSAPLEFLFHHAGR